MIMQKEKWKRHRIGITVLSRQYTMAQHDKNYATADNKKFELMLTRCAKAYSSSGSVV